MAKSHPIQPEDLDLPGVLSIRDSIEDAIRNASVIRHVANRRAAKLATIFRWPSFIRLEAWENNTLVGTFTTIEQFTSEIGYLYQNHSPEVTQFRYIVSEGVDELNQQLVEFDIQTTPRSVH